MCPKATKLFLVLFQVRPYQIINLMFMDCLLSRRASRSDLAGRKMEEENVNQQLQLGAYFSKHDCSHTSSHT